MARLLNNVPNLCIQSAVIGRHGGIPFVEKCGKQSGCWKLCSLALITGREKRLQYDCETQAGSASGIYYEVLQSLELVDPENRLLAYLIQSRDDGICAEEASASH